MAISSHPDAGAGYRPISGLAVAGFGLSALFALGMVLAAIAALSKQYPLLIYPPLLAIPLVTGALSLAGWIQVARSEGTRAGQRLAKWGLILSGAVLLIYFPWRMAKEDAVKREARTFTDAWFADLKKSSNDVDYCMALLDTIEPAKRAELPLQLQVNLPQVQAELRADPNKMAKVKQGLAGKFMRQGLTQLGPMAMFPEVPLVQILRDAGDQATVEFRGMRSWDFQLGSYIVELNYRIKVPEAEYDVVAAVVGMESQAWPGRQWQVMLYRPFSEEGQITKLTEQRTEFGKRVAELQRESYEYAERWLKKVNEHHLDEYYLDTCPPAERAKHKNELVEAMATAQLAGIQAQGEGGATSMLIAVGRLSLLLQHYSAFLAGSLVKGDLNPSNGVTEAILQLAREKFQPTEAQGRLFELAPLTNRPQVRWKIVDGELRFYHDFGIFLPPSHRGNGIVVVSTTDPRRVGALQQSGTSASSGVSGSGDWQIREIQITAAGQLEGR